MTFDQAKQTLQTIVDGATDQADAIVSVETLKQILAGFDNDEQVLIMHNTAVALLLRLGGQAELRPEEALQIHRTHTLQLSRLAEGKMLLRIINKAEQN
jgi:hypothetical protein